MMMMIIAGVQQLQTPHYNNHNNSNNSNTFQKRCFSRSSTANNKDYPDHTLFAMPALSPTMESGSIAAWALQEGASFAAGDALCSVETDKATLDFEAQDDGVLAKILVAPGTQDVAIGTPICVVVEEVDDVAAFKDFVAPTSSSSAAAAATVTEETTVDSAASSSASSAPAPTTAESGAPSILLPSARHLAESSGKDATVLQGSGKGGRVTKGDVMAALNANSLPDLVRTSAASAATVTPAAAAVAPTIPVSSTPPTDLPVPEISTASTFEDIANNKMRKIIASRLTDSKRNVPHSYTSIEVALDNVLKLRKQLVAQHDVKVSVNDFVIRCSALALRDVPEVNGTYDSKTGTFRRNHTIDVSVAVATPTGLITPIVFGTDQLGLSEITRTIRDLATRARDGALQPHEYQGGTFSVSNLGMFGVTEFSAVINPPQAAILAVGGGRPTIVPTAFDMSKDVQDPPRIQTVMTARLSADRRVVDEATAALFLQAFGHYIQKPELLLL